MQIPVDRRLEKCSAIFSAENGSEVGPKSNQCVAIFASVTDAY